MDGRAVADSAELTVARDALALSDPGVVGGHREAAYWRGEAIEARSRAGALAVIHRQNKEKLEEARAKCRAVRRRAKGALAAVAEAARLRRLLEQQSAAIRAHLVTARVLQGDETSWRVQQRRRDGASGRAWLWVGQSHDAVWFHIDPRRSLQAALKVFEGAEAELAEHPAEHPRAEPLRRLLKWRYGLKRFVADPEVPIDNNASERSLRAPVIGRKLSFSNDSWTGARLTGHMYSVLGTLKRHEIDLEHWLHDWLSACAEAARAPPDLTPWLPWSMDPARRQRFQQPRAPPVHG